MMMEYFDTFARNYRAYKGGSWCYEDGLIYLGLEHLHRGTSDARWLDHMVRLISPQILAGPDLLGYSPHDYNIDNILSGRALLYLHDVTGAPQYMAAADLLARQLETHPRTRSGVYWHKLRYPWQVWLDGIFMGAPFQIGYGQATGNDALVEDSLLQVAKALDMTFVSETGLYAHAIDEARKQPWADPTTGHSKAHWARAVGWLAVALVEIETQLGPARFAPLRPRTRHLLARIAELRLDNGLWLQVMDQPDLAGNYEESSASAMFAYALIKGADRGLYDGCTDELVELLARKVMTQTPHGPEMSTICHVAGLGMFEDRFRDGTAEYYLSERCVSDDPKGVGPLMMVMAHHAARDRASSAMLQAR